jgi:glycosyltransferase involved in cell wall biosynthesis
MRIVIDMQGAQSTGSRNRGIGRYTLSLAQAIVRNRGEHEIILALSGLFPDTIESIRANFDGLLPQENIRVWYAPSPVRESQPENIWRRKAAELIREAFIASLKPGVVFIPNFIEGYQNDVVTSIGLFSLDLITVVAVDTLDRAPTAVGNHGDKIHVLRKHEHLKRANLLLVLPPLTVDEVCQCLEIPQERVNVGWLFGEAKTDQQDATTQAMNLLKRLEELTIAAPQSLRLPLGRRPKLAYVSPLPPERSGISDYSAELLPQLARFYDIDVIVDQVGISTPWIIANCGIRTIDWFIQNAQRYSRVLYHFGNSSYHQHMFDLLARVSGVVVLHDFYLVDVHYYREAHALSPHTLTRALYESHGYGAVAERFRVENDKDLVRRYPANLEVLQHAHGIIVHAEHPRRLAREWYGKDFAADWKVIPHLRTPSAGSGRAQSRATLGLKADDLVVCSFGLLSPNKLNHRLLEAWLQSRLARDAHCLLVFVGENHGGEYGAQLWKVIRASGLEKRIRITGWADMPTFRNYLAAADIAVQLRTHSRGETSGAVLDCMNHALPTIVNAHGSMADLPSDAVWMLPDAFDNGQLVEALETLWQDGERRAALGARAREVILTRHAPRACAKQYAEAIEQFHARSKHDSRALTKSIAELDGHSPTAAECLELAQLISHTLPIAKSTRQLLVDVSATCRNDLKTGIQRVVRALVWELLQTPPPGYRVEPVYLTTGEGARWHYRYARKWTSNLLGFSEGWLPDEPVEYSPGDIMLVADFTGGFAVEAKRAGVFKQLKGDGIGLFFVAYDLLPLLMPNFFPPGQFGYMEWLNAASCVADGVICISRTVADEMRSWVDVSGPQRLRPIKIGWFHLGADINASIPTLGLPKDAEQRLSRFSAVPSFLMVGTIEPRKGYLQTLEAFTQLWQAGCDINLVIVGNQGWKGLSEDLRRTIPEIVGRVRNHQELCKHLFWLEEISDEYLEKIYAALICLIAASEGEGFGLPLIEAAQHKLPIIAREISVFREVAGEHAFYFKGLEPQALTDAVWQWLALDKQGKSPRSDNMPRLTWKQSAEQLIKVVFG